MPKVGDISTSELEEISLLRASWLEEALRLVRGGIYLLAGEPGIGKTTLALQVACDLAEQGESVLYLTTEQGPSDLKVTVKRLYGGEIPRKVEEKLFIETLVSLGDLKIWREHIGLPGDEYEDISLVVLDSATMASPVAWGQFEIFERFARVMKYRGVALLAIAHVTKGGKIAGPKRLEHFVDCVLQYRKAFRLRPLFVPKNRFGPAKLEPLILEMGERGLAPSLRRVAVSAAVQGVGFSTLTWAEAQASVRLPRIEERPRINAPFLPRDKIRHLVSAISQLPDIDVSDLLYNINCYIPGKHPYDFGLDLSIVTAILSSYLQREVPGKTAFYGEVDLMGKVRSAARLEEGRILETYPSEFMERLERLEEFMARLKRLETLFVPEEVCEDLTVSLKKFKYEVRCEGVRNLEDLVGKLWPDLRG